jgi:hypothetical protein
MKETLGMGVVGAGAIGIRGALKHLSLPDVQDRVRLAAVCDPVPGRAEAAAQQYGVTSFYRTYEELLADPHVNLVTLCSPIGLHYEQGLAAIEAGKHVHFNKTMTTTVEEADRLIARAAEKGVCLVASPGMMLFPHNRRIRRKILEGALGRLVWSIAGTAGVGEYHLREEFRTGQDVLTQVDPTWYFRRPGGGPQYDVTVYCLHIVPLSLHPIQRRDRVAITPSRISTCKAVEPPCRQVCPSLRRPANEPPRDQCFRALASPLRPWHRHLFPALSLLPRTCPRGKGGGGSGEHSVATREAATFFSSFRLTSPLNTTTLPPWTQDRVCFPWLKGME